MKTHRNRVRFAAAAAAKISVMSSADIIFFTAFISFSFFTGLLCYSVLFVGGRQFMERFKVFRYIFARDAHQQCHLG